jgi:hypothetical protein
MVMFRYQLFTAERIESRRRFEESPDASHMANPRRPLDLMNAPLAANDLTSS